MCPDYKVRFIAELDKAELVNLYHLAKTPLSDKNHPLLAKGLKYNHARRVWAAAAFHKLHPEVSVTAAYKDLDGLLAWD